MTFELRARTACGWLQLLHSSDRQVDSPQCALIHLARSLGAISTTQSLCMFVQIAFDITTLSAELSGQSVLHFPHLAQIEL